MHRWSCTHWQRKNSGVQVSVATPRHEAVFDLRCGEHLTFGSCQCGTCSYDLALPTATSHPGGPVVAGRIVAYADHWRLDNLGGRLSVEDLENPLDMITVVPGRSALPVPFELARLVASAVTVATVYGPEPAEVAQHGFGCPELGSEGGLDLGAKYFAVLLALCEPRLRVSPVATLPTAAEIAERLHRKGISLTPGSVSAQIGYLVDKLRLIPDLEQRAGGRRSWRKEALASVAIRQGLVSVDQLRGW